MKRIIYTLLGIMLTTGAWAEGTLQEQINSAEAGTTVTLTKDVDGSITVPAGKNLTLDLNGHNITATGTAITNNGTLTIKDTQGTGTITSTGNYGICAGSNSTTTIESGNIVSQEFGIGTSYNTGATINVTGGTITARDNAVFGGNGTAREGDPNTFNISGGTFNGEIQSAGYVACGIYSPWKDVFNVSGGTFNITNGCGILGRAGTINVTGGTFNCKGTATGKVGDSRVVVPCSPIVFDTAAGYPAMAAESNITIPSGSTATFTAADGVAAVSVVAAPETPATHIEISGGTYSSSLPSKVLAPGFEPVLDAEGNYVAKAETAVEAKIGETKYATLAAAVAAATAGQTVTLLADISEAIVNSNTNDFTIDLNNKNWISNGDTFKNNGGTVTFTGDGLVKSTATDGIAVWARTGSIIINGGDYENCSNEEATVYVGTTDANLAGKQPTVTINGGSFKNTADGVYKWNTNLKPLTLNIINNIAEANAYQAIVIKGGTFFGNDPSVGDDSQLNKITNNSNFVSSELHATMKEGKFVIEEGGYVAQVGYMKYVTLAEAAATADATIKLLADAEIATIDMLGGKTLEKNGHTLYVKTFALTDATAFSVPFEFTAKTATYTRTMPAGTKYGTVCVPFALNSLSNGTPQLYTFDSIIGEKLTVTEEANVAAATPVVFYTESSEAVFSSKDVVIDPSAAPSTTETLIGTFTNKTITSGLESIYYINGDAFHQAKASLTVPAYRAYINYTPTPSAAKPSVLSLFVDDSETTGVASAVADKATAESLCDINGRVLAAPQKGINILKLANGKTVKLIIK